jgi:serine protease Do
MRKNLAVLLGLAFLQLLGCSSAVGRRQNTVASGAQVNGAPNFVTLVKDLQPAVVNVSATVAPIPAVPNGLLPQSNQENFGSFGIPPTAVPALQRQQGSGFIIGSDGVILTSAHVVRGAKKIVVKLGDKREFDARVIGIDGPTDVAVIKIVVKEKLPTIGLGDSDKLEVGEWVMAVGNPFGLDSTVSSGIISAKGRHIDDPYDRLIQTDTPLNPGSSGGPLINLDGQVIGINKAIVSEGGGSIGISFATPINLIKEVLPELQSEGKVTRGWAGIAIQELNSALAESLGLEKPRGALVADIVKGGPADLGGIKRGDVITEYDGKTVSDALDLPLWIARTPIAKRVAVKIHRDRQVLRLNLTVAKLPEAQIQQPGNEIG